MKVRLTLDVDAHTRYVIARYFGVAASDEKDRTRARATRRQVARFARAAVASAAREYAADMTGRARATARRLRDGAPEPEALVPPAERQPSLLNY